MTHEGFGANVPSLYLQVCIINMLVYIQPVITSKNPTIFIFIFTFNLIFICILIFYYTKQLLSYFIVFIILNNHVIVVHTCVDVTP
jgi:hypothetical protein